MRIVYFGTSDFAVPALERLAKHTILVVSQPDRPSGRGHQLKPSPIKLKALELGLPVATPERARNPEFVAEIEALNADVHVVAAYGQILSVKLLETAKRGGVNLHGSILPFYRGAAPIQRSIMNGDPETGVALMQMDKGMDTGDMISLVTTPIEPDETYGALQTRLSFLAADLIEEWIERIVQGEYPREVQDHERATYAPKIDRTESELHFDQPALQEYNRFRGVTPSPGAFITTRLGRLKIHEARYRDEFVTPGFLSSTKPVILGFASGALELVTVQPEGKPRMSGTDWANGVRLTPGQSLS